MTLIEQDQELRGGHRRQWCAWIHRPPQQFAGGETAQAQPKSVSVIDQELQRGRRTVPKNVQGTRKRVLLPLVTTQCREGVHPFAEIDGGDGQQNPQLGHELQHGLTNRGRRCRELRPGSSAKVANREASACRQSAPRPNESLRPQPSVLPESAKPTTPPAAARRPGERRLFSAWFWASESVKPRHSNATRGTTAKPNNDHARRRPLATAHREFLSGLDACCATVQTEHEYGPDHRKQKA